MEPVDAVVVDEDDELGNDDEHHQQQTNVTEDVELGDSSSTNTWSEDIDGTNGDVVATTSDVRANSNSLASITSPPVVVTGKRVTNHRITIFMIVGSLIL